MNFTRLTHLFHNSWLILSIRSVYVIYKLYSLYLLFTICLGFFHVFKMWEGYWHKSHNLLLQRQCSNAYELYIRTSKYSSLIMCWYSSLTIPFVWSLLVLLYQPVGIYPFNYLIPVLLCVSSYIIEHEELFWYVLFSPFIDWIFSHTPHSYVEI